MCCAVIFLARPVPHHKFATKNERKGGAWDKIAHRFWISYQKLCPRDMGSTKGSHAQVRQMKQKCRSSQTISESYGTYVLGIRTWECIWRVGLSVIGSNPSSHHIMVLELRIEWPHLRPSPMLPTMTIWLRHYLYVFLVSVQYWEQDWAGFNWAMIRAHFIDPNKIWAGFSSVDFHPHVPKNQMMQTRWCEWMWYIFMAHLITRWIFSSERKAEDFSTIYGNEMTTKQKSLWISFCRWKQGLWPPPKESRYPSSDGKVPPTKFSINFSIKWWRRKS